MQLQKVEIVRILFNFQCHTLCDKTIGSTKAERTILPRNNKGIDMIVDNQPECKDDEAKTDPGNNINQAVHAQIYPCCQFQVNQFVSLYS